MPPLTPGHQHEPGERQMLSLAYCPAIEIMTTTAEQAEALVEALAEEAQKQWGENWLPSLVSAYCEIESAETGKLIKPVQRRSQLGRTLEGKNPTAETLLRLVKAVGGQLELTFIRKEVKRF